MLNAGFGVQYHADEWHLVEGTSAEGDRFRPLVPVQVDGHSCGVMTLLNMHFSIADLTPRYPYTVQGENYVNLRKRVALFILQKIISCAAYRATRRPRVLKP